MADSADIKQQLMQLAFQVGTATVSRTKENIRAPDVLTSPAKPPALESRNTTLHGSAAHRREDFEALTDILKSFHL
jgi:hypothetical protein